MRGILFAIGFVFILTSAASAVEFNGCMAPTLRVSEDYQGVGLAFNRIAISGESDLRRCVVSHLTWKVEADLLQSGEPYSLQWAFVRAHFDHGLSARMGALKTSFSQEATQPTGRVISADKYPLVYRLVDGGFTGKSYGLEGQFKNPWLEVIAGAYSGKGEDKNVAEQDDVLDYGVRAYVFPFEGLRLGGHVMAVTDVDSLAWAGSLEYKYQWGGYSCMCGGRCEGHGSHIDGNSLHLQAEYGSSDFFDYYMGKAQVMHTWYGVHLGYSVWDPCDGDEETMFTPGFVFAPSDKFRIQFEYQKTEDTETYVVQPVFVW